jgi:outer membrane protein W
MLRINSCMLILLASVNTFAQEVETKLKYKPSFGFNVGLNQSALYNSNDKDQLTIKNGLGFRLGITSNFPIKKQWSIAPKAELSFNNARITENSITYKVDPYNLDFMAHVKYNFKGFNSKVRPYCYFGPNVRVPVSSNSDNSFYSTKTSFALDFAIGVDCELKNFLISPEIRLSGGLTDIRKNPSGKSLHGSNVAFIINFSGK